MSDLYYLTKLPKNSIENPILLLMLHGYGSNEDDLFSFASELDENLLIISARAPLALDFGGFAWYSIHFTAGQDKFSDIPEAIQARDQISEFIDQLDAKYHFDKDKSMLMGFSQGAILSYAVALSYPDIIKNVIAMSGYALPEIIQDPKNKSDYKSLRFFCSHGTVDPVIPIEWARKSDAFLTQNQIRHEYHEYPVGHGVAPRNVSDMKDWMREIIK
ncbi:MAG: dienelactone hydrolase family protein [Flavobacteriaceae bacterium]|nr:dienelactone hydrolase family protein [Flavobacteriaceae bacterium]